MIEWIGQHNGALIAIATIAYTFFSGLMWWSMRQSLELTRNSFEETQRPHVGVGLIKSSLEASSGRFKFELELVNAGSVPARELRTEWTAKIGGSQRPRITPLERMTILPNRSISYGETIDNLDVQNVMRGTTHLEIQVDLVYKGRGNREYRTTQSVYFNHLTQLLSYGDSMFS